MVVVFGYLVKYKKWTFLISGYNTLPKKEKEKYNTDYLCKAYGNMIFISAASLLIGIFGEVMRIPKLVTVSWVLFILLVIGGVIYYGDGSRFKQKNRM